MNLKFKNPAMISLNPMNGSEIISTCPTCKKAETLNNERCYCCQTNQYYDNPLNHIK